MATHLSKSCIFRADGRRRLEESDVCQSCEWIKTVNKCTAFQLRYRCDLMSPKSSLSSTPTLPTQPVPETPLNRRSPEVEYKINMHRNFKLREGFWEIMKKYEQWSTQVKYNSFLHFFFRIISHYINKHSEQARPLHTKGPRDVPRCGALSLIQKPLHYRGGSEELVLNPFLVAFNPVFARAYVSRDCPGWRFCRAAT